MDIDKTIDLREMSMAIDVWDDIFSDFDPRSLAERTVSEDFINELKRRCRQTRRGSYIISFYAPVVLKDDKTERVVIHRLKEHFKHRTLSLKKEVLSMQTRGVIFVIIGIIFSVFLVFSTYYNFFSALTLRILEIIFMPLGWFGIWEGCSQIVDAFPIFSKEVSLFDKLSRAEYRFYYS